MPAIGASSFLGAALETVSGTWATPAKFIPYNSESLTLNMNMVERRPIRNTPALVDLLPGNASVEGDVEFDVSPDVLLYFLAASRWSYVKTGTAPSITYTFTPSPIAVPTKTLSLTVRRGSQVFGYPGCVVGSFTISIADDGKLTSTVSVLGANEVDQTAGTFTPIWPTVAPFNAGQYKLEIPTATQVYDTDTFEFSSEDNAEAQSRIKNTSGSQFIKFGENNVTISLARDFENRTEYEQFKLGTGKSITLTATRDANTELKITMPVAKMNSYAVNVGSVADLVRAEIEYMGVIDGTGKSAEIVLKTAENLT